MFAVALTIAAVALQSGLQYWFYRERVLNRWAIAFNDGFVFGLPLLTAILAFSLIAIQFLNRINLSALSIIAIGVAFALVIGSISTCIAMIISFNTFGT